jgi:lactate dehydrogenase-like 2-hydroxyacid dehydrogenase
MKPQNPLLRMTNVILTGHSAWYSTTSDSGPGYWQKAMVQVILALKGKWPPYAVNPQVKDQWCKKWGA